MNATAEMPTMVFNRATVSDEGEKWVGGKDIH